MITKRGSQNREPIGDTEYKVSSALSAGQVVLVDEVGRCELWIANDNFAGYVIEIGGIGYEFVRGY